MLKLKAGDHNSVQTDRMWHKVWCFVLLMEEKYKYFTYFLQTLRKTTEPKAQLLFPSWWRKHERVLTLQTPRCWMLSVSSETLGGKKKILKNTTLLYFPLNSKTGCRITFYSSSLIWPELKTLVAMCEFKHDLSWSILWYNLKEFTPVV